MVTTGISTMRMSATLLMEALGESDLSDHGHGGHGGHGHSHALGHSHGPDILEDGHVNAVAVGACLLTIASGAMSYACFLKVPVFDSRQIQFGLHYSENWLRIVEDPFRGSIGTWFWHLEENPAIR